MKFTEKYPNGYECGKKHEGKKAFNKNEDMSNKKIINLKYEID